MKTKTLYNYEVIVPSRRYMAAGKDEYLIVLHGPNMDGRHHKIGFKQNFMYDPKNPFILIPKSLAFSAIEYGGTLVSVNPVYGEFDDSAQETIENILVESNNLLLMMETSFSPGFAKRMLLDDDDEEDEDDDNSEDTTSERDALPPYVSRRSVITGKDKDDLHLTIRSETSSKEHLDEMHEKYLRPIETPIGTCYECDAIMINRFLSASYANFLYYLNTELPEEEVFKENNYAAFRNALKYYPGLWSYLQHMCPGVIVDHASEIYERNTDIGNLESELIMRKVRRCLYMSASVCAMEEASYNDPRRLMNKLILSMDDKELEHILDQLRSGESLDFANRIEEATNGLISQETAERVLKESVELNQIAQSGIHAIAKY